MVIGRGAELARIDQLLASARRGTSEPLVITGEAAGAIPVPGGAGGTLGTCPPRPRSPCSLPRRSC